MGKTKDLRRIAALALFEVVPTILNPAEEIPPDALTTDDGEVLTTDDGEILLTEE